MKDMTIRKEFIDVVLFNLEDLLDRAKTDGEKKLIYEMTVTMKECLDFGD